LGGSERFAILTGRSKAMFQRRSKILDVENIVSIRDFFEELPDSRNSINQKLR